MQNSTNNTVVNAYNTAFNILFMTGVGATNFNYLYYDKCVTKVFKFNFCANKKVFN